jgi:hypothetical protein
LQILVNGEMVNPLDPLMRTPDSNGIAARLYGPEIRLSVRTGLNGPDADTGEVVVRFTELPVFVWYRLNPVEKRRMGITRAAGVSVLRAGREIDYGWFFVGSKRRENYDDWWRCEVEFDPILDEEFGVAHTKQQIRPSDALVEILTPIIEPVARILNRRAREAHEHLARKERERNPVISVAESVDDVLKDVAGDFMALVQASSATIGSAKRSSSELYAPIVGVDGLTLMFNESHVFYRKLIQAARSGDQVAKKSKETIEALLLAAARAEITGEDSDIQAVTRFRERWGKILSCYIKP